MNRRADRELKKIFGESLGSWRQVWPAIADTLGMEVGPDAPLALDEAMPPREPDWRRIVRTPPTTLASTIKARQAGFHDCMDTEDMFRKWCRRFQERRWLPPPR